ncbi:MAG: 2-C-methyl-D-erythritol 2,4-cyclodiphosphate synthase [Syntrophales bacterium]|jgi:2-C-methyl-D-erythritol 2,4-cyclodiphosphate synthase
MRVGLGYDSHRFADGRKLVVGGVEIPFDMGLLGHSDADILIHAVCDAILGAVGQGDIGCHFPDTDPAWRDISSMILLGHVVALAKQNGFAVSQLDATIIMEKPRLLEYMPAMVRNLALVLNVPGVDINIKAKTNEGMGWIGNGEGAAALAIITVEPLKGME